MNHRVIVAFAILSVFLSQTSSLDVLNYVDLRIGTGGFGFGVGGDPVGPQWPFGNIRTSPDTRRHLTDFDFQHYGGYHNNDTTIIAFSHTHMVGPGVADLGNIGVMPVRAVDNTTLEKHSSDFNKSKETISPGYYAVALDNPGVAVELTACTTHVAKHRYTSVSKKPWSLLFDLTHSLTKDAVVDSLVETNRTHLWGYVLSKGALTGRNGKGVKVFFTARFEQVKPSSIGMLSPDSMFPGKNASQGAKIGAYFTFDTPIVEMTISISYISIEQSWRNMAAAGTQATVTFNTCKANCQSFWREALSRVKVGVDDEDDPYWNRQLTVFYTALYHSLMAPTSWSEAQNVHLGMDNQVHQGEDGRCRYTDMSIWDIHRTQVPLLHLLYPEVGKDISYSLVGMMQEGGDLPRWPIANVYASCMIGNHANVILADAVVKNLIDFNITAAYEGMVQSATNSSRAHNARPCLEDYLTLGYVPSDKCGKASSLTLAYSYDDFAIAVVAKHLNKTKDVETFMKRSENYRNLWDEKRDYMCQRDSKGGRHCSLDPAFHEWILNDNGFCEGDEAEWRWFVPHNQSGLVDLFGKPETYVSELADFFDKTFNFNYTLLPNPHYWPGNEPDILEPFQFNVAGRPDLTQKYSRAIMNQYYTTAPDGLPGNDDYGTLSAWFVWAALGIYPVTGTDTYLLGSPVFKNVTMLIPNGFEFQIFANNASQENIYVNHARINGLPIDMTTHSYISHHQLMTGRKLEMDMQNHPSQ